MSDPIKHECGQAFIRLRKPLPYYVEKYDRPLYGLNKLQLLMQKMRNRGQDGAGLAVLKLNPKQGERYISRKRSISHNYLNDLFTDVYRNFKELPSEKLSDVDWLKDNKPYVGEVLMGHLRYGTHGKNTIETCHPFLRSNNWLSRTLLLSGNFNLTNVDELFEVLIKLGQFPKERSDSITILEKFGHFLDDEVQKLYGWFKKDGYDSTQINEEIFKHLDIARILNKASKDFDGGYVINGITGHGDAFVMRDPNGIRPAFYYENDEVVVAASERPAIQAAFDISHREILEIPPAHVLITKADGRCSVERFLPDGEPKACSFERIYFSRGNDRDIYLERKMLGRHLAKPVLEAIEYNLEDAVFSFIPNTAESSYFGLIAGIEENLDEFKKKRILEMRGKINEEKIDALLRIRPRVEKIVVKDAKLRTFIASDDSRGEMVSHVYDVTYGIVRNGIDTLVIIDDSIVRGTTLRESIIQALSRLKPKKIIVLSSAPQIRYPDCYGIDMSKMHEFVAFQALVKLLHENGKKDLLDEVLEKCKLQEQQPIHKVKNEVQVLYDQFTYEQVSNKIAEIITPKNIEPEIQVIYQTIEGLHTACPDHKGDWYFTGNYPTPGGNRVVNRSFINFMEKKNVRAY